MSRALILGAGHSTEPIIKQANQPPVTSVTTLDIDPACNPDILWDLNVKPWSRPRFGFKRFLAKPIESESYDQIHAYEVLEHLGRQGDLKSFFADFGEIYRILKPGGFLMASVPRWDSLWAFSDPGHTRVISSGTLAFLSQRQYQEQVGKTPMADYRALWTGDFEVAETNEVGERFWFILVKR